MLLSSMAHLGLSLLFAAQYPAPAPAPIPKTPAHAAAKCPWFAEGTAARLLGGPVLATVRLNAGKAKDSSCRFSPERPAAGLIEIHVSSVPIVGCANASAPLKGIGNEAVRCILPASGAERIVSRVRDQFFSVTFEAAEKSATPDPYATPDDDPLERIAEQIAGSLF